MAQTKRPAPMDDIARQARQGSVAAIIQLLNEKLADSGVRTRAIFADGVLQLLCEAADVSQLGQSALVERIRQILEAIAPRNIRRVNINSRIVREQQLLWLEEINRDPSSQLLWVEEITLAKPNLLKRLAEDLKNHKPSHASKQFPKPTPPFVREKRQFRRGLIGGLSLSLLLLLFGWGVYAWLRLKQGDSIQAQPSKPAKPRSSENSNSVQPILPPAAPQALDPFPQAVRLAELASATGKTARSSAQWLDLAAKWQQASDLMKAVPPTDTRYKTARNRAVLYRQNSEAAQQEAGKLRS